jgi:muramoyltetrapeptide carboxypeptidase
MCNRENLLPGKLFPGDTIGVIAPAGPVSEEETAAGFALLAARGYRVRPGRHLFQKKGYLSTDDSGRLQDLHEMFADHEVKAVFCARGGYGTMRLIGMLDYDLVRSNPKIIAGYSDITALLLSLRCRTGLVGFHGPMIRDCAFKGLGSMIAFLDFLEGLSAPSLVLSGPVLREGRARGPLVGGNLTMMSHLAGTPFMPDLKGCVVFLEDRGEALYRIDRMLAHLRLCGYLEKIAGLVAGAFTDCGDTGAVLELLGEVTADTGVPVVSGLPVGHGQENLSIPVGVCAEMDTSRPTLRVTGRWFKE